MIRPEDLAKMLDTIEKLAQSGANEAAQELLVAARRNPAQSAARHARPDECRRANTPLSQMLDELSEMMRRQQQLMDDTTRMPEEGEMGEGEEMEGAQGRTRPVGRACRPAGCARPDARGTDGAPGPAGPAIAAILRRGRALDGGRGRCVARQRARPGAWANRARP